MSVVFYIENIYNKRVHKSILKWMSQIFMQNDSSKLTLSSLANKFLNISYIQLVIFLYILFEDYIF
jgi:hypothetical protein